ncbi:DUF2987 domain-containing protein [Colwelliaceae bacterium BS250]
MIKNILIAGALSLVSLSSQAVDMEYKGFYQRLDLINDNELDQITMAFYLVDYQTRDRCELSKATMLAKDMSAMDIDIAADGELLVPYSEDLYDKFAFLRVEQAKPRQNCTLQMQIQSKDKTKTEYSYAELALLTAQMQDLVDGFGSFLWFMMPNVAGLHISLTSTDDIAFIADDLNTGLNCTDNKCNLAVDMDNESTNKAISFAPAPMVISPWIADD